jgi:hypothetical protein
MDFSNWRFKFNYGILALNKNKPPQNHMIFPAKFIIILICCYKLYTIHYFQRIKYQPHAYDKKLNVYWHSLQLDTHRL